MTLRVACGNFHVFGHVLLSGRSYQLYSPYSANALSIEASSQSAVPPTDQWELLLPTILPAIDAGGVVAAAFVKHVNTAHLAIGDAFRFVAKAKPALTGRRTAKQITPPPPCSDNGVESYLEPADEPILPIPIDHEAVQHNPLGLGDFHIIDVDDGRFQLTVLSDSWWAARKTVMSLAGSVPELLVCGKKNSGKSSFARFMVNSLLNQFVSLSSFTPFFAFLLLLQVP
jgi:hypothetical protein